MWFLYYNVVTTRSYLDERVPIEIKIHIFSLDKPRLFLDCDDSQSRKHSLKRPRRISKKWVLPKLTSLKHHVLVRLIRGVWLWTFVHKIQFWSNFQASALHLAESHSCDCTLIHSLDTTETVFNFWIQFPKDRNNFTKCSWMDKEKNNMSNMKWSVVTNENICSGFFFSLNEITSNQFHKSGFNFQRREYIYYFRKESINVSRNIPVNEKDCISSLQSHWYMIVSERRT